MKKQNINILLILALIFQSFYFSILNAEEADKDILIKLDEVSKPQLPIFGKITDPIKGGVAIYRYVPETIYLEKVSNQEVSEEISEKPEKVTETLSLLPSTESKAINDIEEKRKEMQKAEIEGLNFIQPSLELSQNEQKAIDEFFSRNEQEQLLNLWQATIERNKTIQYIVERLAPQNSPQESRSLLSKTLGAAIFLPFYALQAFSNNQVAYYGSQVGGRVLGSVLQGKMEKDKTKLQLSQTEAIVLFMLIDDVAERLRQRYHDYKKAMVERSLASKELEETKQDNADAVEQDSPVAQILANIQRRAVEREVRKLDTDVRYFKNSLIELAGTDAVNQLDDQLKLELVATQNTPLDWDSEK